MSNNRICDILKIEYPLIQGAMTWICSAKMVAAVSNAGGMGVLASNSGQTTITTDSVETAERIRREIHKVRELTDKPFGLNYLIYPEGMEDADIFGEPMLQMAYEEKVKNIVAVGPVNRRIFKELKDHGCTIIFREGDPTPEGAKAAEAEGADIIIATGYDEGGVIPIRPIGTFSIVPVIVDAVNVPVMAAGGIVDKRGVKASFALGAEGVYVGTRFIASTECPVPDRVKQDIINARSQDMVQFKSLPAYLRSTPHKLACEYAKLEESGATREAINANVSGLIRTGMLEGNLDDGINSLNVAVDQIKDIRTCKEIVDSLMDGVVF